MSSVSGSRRGSHQVVGICCFLDQRVYLIGHRDSLRVHDTLQLASNGFEVLLGCGSDIFVRFGAALEVQLGRTLLR